jgi:FADH2 O2-dependent halogenase
VLPARLVVDASGRRTLLGTQLGIKHNDPAFDQFTMHNWFEGFDRGPVETAEHVHIHVLARSRTWVWQIPVSAGVTSLGIVTRRCDFQRASEDPEAWFARQLAEHPKLAGKFATARPLHAFARDSNFSYSLERIAGNGWIVIGDACQFVDPLFSSGVSVAAESARQAVEPIRRSLREGDMGAHQFAEWQRSVRITMDRWRDLVAAFYRLPPLLLDMLGNDSGKERLRPLLQGEMHTAYADSVLEEIGERIDVVAADPQHPWHRDLVAIE